MSENPDFPDAHPTAPGGMSQKALVMELAKVHGWTKAQLIEADMSWPEMIEAVAQGRLAREQEAKAALPPDVAVDSEGIWSDYDEREDGGFDADHPDDQPDVSVTEVQHVMFLGMPDTKDFIFDGHAGAGPSGAERWMNCTASLAAAREFLETLSPNQQVQFASGSDAARQGTTAHAAAETEARLLLGEIDQSEADMTLLELAIEPENGGEAYDEEMAEYITEYVDLVKTYIDSGRQVLIEARVSAVVELLDVTQTDVAEPTGEVHEIVGSGDCIVLPSEDEPELVVGDLKYGDGIDVDVNKNPQIRIYALGALALLVDEEGNLTVPVEKVTYHIIQPRLGGIKTWTESVEDLLDWRDEVLAPALSLALVGPEGGATYNPSELACQWCPARGSCAALAEARVESAAGLFDTIVEAEFADGPGAFPETTSLTDTRLGELLAQITGLIDIKDDLKEEVQRRLHRGGSVPGFQLVSYTPPRKWKEQAQDEIAAGLAGLSSKQRTALFREPALITPTQALKVLKDNEKAAAAVTDLIDVPDKRPVVAPVGDRRKTWEGRPPEQMFPDTEDGA